MQIEVDRIYQSMKRRIKWIKYYSVRIKANQRPLFLRLHQIGFLDPIPYQTFPVVFSLVSIQTPRHSGASLLRGGDKNTLINGRCNYY